MDSFSTTATITTTDYNTACPHRLPCGVCRLLLTRCPICAYTATPTWDSNRVTCKDGSVTQAYNEKSDE